MASEKLFETKVRRWLRSIGAWEVKIWGGGFQKAGIPDILACWHGRLLAIEVKAERGRPTELQLHTIKEIQKAGGYARVLYPKDFDKFKEEVRMIDEARLESLICDYWKVKDIADRASEMLDGIKMQIESALDGGNYSGEQGKVTWVPVKESTTVDWKKFEKAEPDEAKGIMDDYPKKTKTGGYYKYSPAKEDKE